MYRFGNLTLESNLPIELAIVEGAEPGISFQLISSYKYKASPWHWFHHFYLPQGEPWLSLAKHEQNYLLSFSNLADFIFLTGTRKIYCYARSEVPVDTIQHLFLDQVMPRVLSWQGCLVLHAGAVLTPTGAIAFLGEAGWGKSTLTTSFCQQGFPLLADDCLLLQEEGEGFLAVPSYPGLRLWPETVTTLFGEELQVPHVAHYTEKERLNLSQGQISFCSEPVPLQRLYLLVPPEERVEIDSITLTRLSPREAFMALVQAAYRLDITDQLRAKEEFERLSRLVNSVSLYRLAFPQDLSLLPDIRAAIMKNEN